MHMELSLIIPSFIAGLLTFLAPCTLPLVPGYLGFISGASLDDLKDPEKSKRARWKIFLNGLFFIIGFSLVFIVLGTLAGFAGRSLIQYRFWLSRIGGAFVIIFGFFMMGVLKLPFLHQERQLHVPSVFARGKALNSFLLGSAFAFGWTPCVGPILGSILALAAVSSTAGQGALLLSVFSLGLAVPFLIIAIGIGWASQHLHKIARYLNAISLIGGAFLVFLGILLVTDSFAIWITYFYRFFNFINYDRLLDYL